MPRVLQARLSDRIRVCIRDLPDDAHDMLIEALCIPNLAREKAKKHHVHGWEQMPEEIPMFGLEHRERGDFATLTIPRGFAHELVAGLAAFGAEIEWIDERARPASFRVGHKIEYRDHQIPLVSAILEAEQGIVKAPPGAGKTVSILAAGRRAGTKCIVVVNTLDILDQWVNRIHEHLGDHLQVGRIGGNDFKIGPIWTIATAQTLHARFDELEEDGFFEKFGFACLDESHHATAETYNRIMDRFTACIRIGASATPDKTGDFELAKMILGPIIHITGYDDIDAEKPKIIRIKTDFGFAFKPTKSRFQRSNYPDLVKELIWDRPRNELIVRCIMREQGHHCLVLTKRHEHIDILEAMLLQIGYRDPIWRLTGKDKKADREEGIRMIGLEPGCMISTLADEALDVPRIDRGFLAFPQRNTGLIEQQVGRFARKHPDKEDALLYDFVDLNVSVLSGQARSRLHKVYKKLGFEVVTTTEGELFNAR